MHYSGENPNSTAAQDTQNAYFWDLLTFVLARDNRTPRRARGGLDFASRYYYD